MRLDRRIEWSSRLGDREQPLARLGFRCQREVHPRHRRELALPMGVSWRGIPLVRESPQAVQRERFFEVPLCMAAFAFLAKLTADLRRSTWSKRNEMSPIAQINAS